MNKQFDGGDNITLTAYLHTNTIYIVPEKQNTC